MEFGKRVSSSSSSSSSLSRLRRAKGFGVEGKTVDARANLDTAIDTMLNHDGPYLLEVKVVKEGNVFPMVPAGASVSDVRLE